ncbi:CenpB-DNA-bind-domain-containing protein [Zopfia rhizophila CBS 207.26]|uniref:CenpB-DNA-bind-domain-containing protein n=1 Tax=Zopfia rhizophila CBS 207.26 TaxID=1314779 RepID=A0A6A6EXB1_9PEZI|nr:CenpB-DNA-bind-domain-containing protein [Zopfia rhizophila CBS 207.26]
MPQWPSMLTSQSTYIPPIFSSAPVPVTPASATPVSATSTRSRAYTSELPMAGGSTSLRDVEYDHDGSEPTVEEHEHIDTKPTPQKTLTDADRRRMCLYHEEHPTVKQTEIGAMFGVERSTVSKVLRQKEKYLYQDDGSRSPIKRSKGKFPDIERALSNWARNHQRQGLPLSDVMIREKARFFATTIGNSESHLKANSTSWLEKFKQKNNLMRAKSGKSSIAEESEGTSNPPSTAQTPSGSYPLKTMLKQPRPAHMTIEGEDYNGKSKLAKIGSEPLKGFNEIKSKRTISEDFTKGADFIKRQRLAALKKCPRDYGRKHDSYHLKFIKNFPKRT